MRAELGPDRTGRLPLTDTRLATARTKETSCNPDIQPPDSGNSPLRCPRDPGSGYSSDSAATLNHSPMPAAEALSQPDIVLYIPTRSAHLLTNPRENSRCQTASRVRSPQSNLGIVVTA
ncbi:hypothetical protein chiPu_0000093 [Chiloscyllium punctatum]|uniref:Uncharacterized protein n=1 Tax=Chiloscyllium punctatum TaxID=137246 RepID=A0A401RNC4_CHIPU|nr:hypothetical protein [Chiloscyllium punctatum]